MACSLRARSSTIMKAAAFRLGCGARGDLWRLFRNSRTTRATARRQSNGLIRGGPYPGGPGEGERFAGEGEPGLGGVRGEAEPLAHRRALVRVEPVSLAAGDEGVDPFRGQLDDQAPADQHGEDLVLVAQAAAAETAAAPRRGDPVDADQRVDDVFEALREVARRGR